MFKKHLWHNKQTLRDVCLPVWMCESRCPLSVFVGILLSICLATRRWTTAWKSTGHKLFTFQNNNNNNNGVLMGKKDGGTAKRIVSCLTSATAVCDQQQELQPQQQPKNFAQIFIINFVSSYFSFTHSTPSAPPSLCPSHCFVSSSPMLSRYPARCIMAFHFFCDFFLLCVYARGCSRFSLVFLLFRFLVNWCVIQCASM